MISLYAGVAAGGLFVTGIIGSYFYGVSVGSDLEAGKAARDREVAEIAMNAAAVSTAGEIAKLEVKHVTIRQSADTVIREVPVYRECRHDARVLRDINAARGFEPDPAGSGVLPSASAPGR